MADTKISALTDGETAETGDRLPAARDSSNVYVTVAYIVAAAVSAAGTAFATALGLAASSLQTGDIGTTVQGYSAAINGTTASFTTEKDNKLSGIEASADVTDATNVAAAGAAMNSANLSGLNNAVNARTNLLIVTLDTTTYEALDPPNADTLYFITDAE